MFQDIVENGEQSLKQGEKFNKMTETISKLDNHQFKIIEQGSENILEGLENMMPGESKLDKISDGELNTLNNLENKFNTTLNQYKSAFKIYLTELADKQNNPAMSYKNKTVTGPGGSKYWVNNMGYARKFTTDAWSTKDASCPESSGNISQQELSTYLMGPDMGEYEKCGTVGINVKSSSAGGTAWLAPNGEKHPYQDFRNKHKSCPSTVTTLTPEQYQGIPIGKSWAPSDACDILGSSESKDLVDKLNMELMAISNEMNEQVKVLTKKDKHVDSQTKLQKQRLIKRAKVLDAERKKVEMAITSIKTSEGDLQDKKLETSSVSMQYFTWLLAFVTLSGIAVKQILKS